MNYETPELDKHLVKERGGERIETGSCIIYKFKPRDLFAGYSATMGEAIEDFNYRNRGNKVMITYGGAISSTEIQMIFINKWRACE